MVVNPEPHLRPLTDRRDPTRDRITGPPEFRSLHCCYGPGPGVSPTPASSTAPTMNEPPGPIHVERRPNSSEPEARPKKKQRACTSTTVVSYTVAPEHITETHSTGLVSTSAPSHPCSHPAASSPLITNPVPHEPASDSSEDIAYRPRGKSNREMPSRTARIDVRPPSPPLVPPDASSTTTAAAPTRRISVIPPAAPKSNPPQVGLELVRTITVPFRSWTDAEDQELISYKNDTKSRPSWKTIGSRLNRDPEVCCLRWAALKPKTIPSRPEPEAEDPE